jgi:hypothetical protein
MLSKGSACAIGTASVPDKAEKPVTALVKKTDAQTRVAIIPEG